MYKYKKSTVIQILNKLQISKLYVYLKKVKKFWIFYDIETAVWIVQWMGNR